jgi:hypothetical protein
VWASTQKKVWRLISGIAPIQLKRKIAYGARSNAGTRFAIRTAMVRPVVADWVSPRCPCPKAYKISCCGATPL